MPPPPYPTQSLIAKRLGVSQGLVSRALAGRAELIGASPLTIKKIRRIASDWDYQPSVAALTLRGVPTRTMGVMVKNFDDPYFGQLIGALQFLARDSGHSLLLTGGTREDFTSLQKHRVDGVILAGSDFPTSDLSSFIQEGRPVVHIGTGPLFFGATQICMDEEAGIKELVSYLVALGHRNIGFIGRKVPSNFRRGEIIRQYLRTREVGMPSGCFFSFDGDDNEIAEHTLESIRSLPIKPTALLAAEDSIALALLRRLAEAGWRIPQDLSITGIDDISSSAQSIPPLTTLRQPVSEIAAATFRILSSPVGTHPAVIISGKVIFRESCAPPSP